MANAGTSGKAVGSLVCGILSFFICGVILGVVAIVLGKNAKEEIAASGGSIGGQGLATAGQILGAIAMVLWAIGIVLRLTGTV